MWYLVSRILWHKRINSSGDCYIWYSPATFHHNFYLQLYAVPFQWRLLIFIWRNLWHWILEVSEKQVLQAERLSHVYETIKNWGSGPYNSLCQNDIRKYFLGHSLTWNWRETCMIDLVWEMGEIWRCSCWEKDNFVLIL